MRPKQLAVAGLLLGACGGKSDPKPSAFDLPPGQAQSDLPCDVQKVLATSCLECHSSPPRFGAPMPLVTRDDLLKPAPTDGTGRTIDALLARVASDAMPMPPPPNARLSAEDQAILRRWLDAGTPAFGGTCEAPPAPFTQPDGGAAACTPDTVLKPSSPWAMPKTGGDVYVCWGAELTADTPRHVTGFVPRIDNAAIVHHVVLFEAPNAVSPEPAPCNPGGSLTWRMVMGWAPGAGALELPPEAGFPIATDGKATHYVVQMHYSNPQALENQLDTSGFDLCTGDPRPMEADVMAFGTQEISIPPNPPNGGVHEQTCDIQVPKLFDGIHFFAAMPHMHKLGHHMSTTLIRPGGGELDMGTTPSFSFDTQAWKPIDATAATFDKIRTTCAWKNATGSTVSFGESTDEEMCYSFTIYWPKVKAATWSWAFPALQSTCH